LQGYGMAIKSSAMAPIPSWIDRKLQESLEPCETVLWREVVFESPTVKDVARPIWVTKTPVLAVIGSAFILISIISGKLEIGAPVVIGVFLISSFWPFFRRVTIRPAYCYVLTDKRALTFKDSELIHAISLTDISFFTKVTRRNGSGNLYFFRRLHFDGEDSYYVKEHGFKRIADVCYLEKIVLQLLTANNGHGTELTALHRDFVDATNVKNQIRLRVLLQQELMTGEAIAWMGQTVRSALVKRKLISPVGSFELKELMSVAAISLMMVFTLSIMSDRFFDTFSTFLGMFSILLFIIIFIFTIVWITDIILTLFGFNEPYYIVTNKRVIIIYRDNRVRIFFPNYINDIKRTSVTPMFSDVSFFKECLYSEKGKEVNNSYEFLHIQDGEQAEQALLALVGSVKTAARST
jgi:hypothetical protein